METIRLEFQPEIKEKILQLLSSFSSNELQIIQEDQNFEENKQKLNFELEKVNNGTTEYCSPEDLDKIMDKLFSKYDSEIK